MELGELFYTARREEWRAWLRRHHSTAKEVWLVFYNKASGKPRLPYNDAVEEALCFGWIDSTVKKLDEERFAQRFTPRKGAWSELNKERARRLIKAKRMAPAGLAALKGAHAAPRLAVAKDVREALEAAGAWARFQRLPASYKRIRIGWIESARGRPQFGQRLRYFVKMTAKGKRYGMVQ